MKETVGNRVYELRNKTAVTQEQLAEAVGVARQTIIAIEKGNYIPSVLLALKIAKFFSASTGGRSSSGGKGGKTIFVEEIFKIKYEK